jgi:hypothetical protein
MTGRSPIWQRHLYYRLFWQKPSGAQLSIFGDGWDGQSYGLDLD